MIRLTSILREIGEGTAKPFKYKKSGSRKRVGPRTQEWSYDIDAYAADANGDNIAVPIELKLRRIDRSHIAGPEVLLLVEFKHDQTKTDRKRELYDAVNNREYMYRIMSTIKSILQKELARDSAINTIAYLPIESAKDAQVSPDATQRHRLYQAYIRAVFPGAQWQRSPGSGIVRFRVR